MSNSSEDQLEWWRTTERVIDQIPEISDAVMAIQGKPIFQINYSDFLHSEKTRQY